MICLNYILYIDVSLSARLPRGGGGGGPAAVPRSGVTGGLLLPPPHAAGEACGRGHLHGPPHHQLHAADRARLGPPTACYNARLVGHHLQYKAIRVQGLSQRLPRHATHSRIRACDWPAVAVASRSQQRSQSQARIVRCAASRKIRSGILCQRI